MITISAAGLARYDLQSGGTIEENDDVARVRSLELRAPMHPAQLEGMSRALCSDPAKGLRPDQGLALREFYEVGGLLAPMQVGSGKTLVSLLLARMCNAQRPVLIVPASLRDKTRAEYLGYQSEGWAVALPRILSYAELGRPNKEHELLIRNPDLIIADEAHRLRNLHAAVTRRVARCVQLINPKFAALSGSLITDKLSDWWHLALWALGGRAPVPTTHAEAVRWGQALDRDTDGMLRVDLGALKSIPGGYHQHARSVRGVVPTSGEGCTAKIVVSEWSPKLPAELVLAIKETKATGTRPDGELLEESDIVDCMQQLACGFWYTWDPPPPEWWLDPRRAWAKFVRGILEGHLPGFDSPSQVVAWLDYRGAQFPAKPSMRAARAGQPLRAQPLCRMTQALAQLGDQHSKTRADSWHAEGLALLTAWRQVRDEFTPNVVPVWIDDAPLRMVAEYARQTPKLLIWTKYRAVGERLAKLGVPYYPGGTDPQTATPGRSIALSIAAHSVGRNLQAWDRNLVLNMPANARGNEQLIGRSHRPGQKSDTVRVALYTVIGYHRETLARVRTESESQSRAAGFDLKLKRATYE